jgi:hypothetical protein
VNWLVQENPPSEPPRSKSDDMASAAVEAFADLPAQERIDAYVDEFDVLECFQSLKPDEALKIVEVLDNHYAEDMDEKVSERAAEESFHRTMDPEDYPGADR